jgi:tetratricopeptide (TPR) repeat protein
LHIDVGGAYVSVGKALVSTGNLNQGLRMIDQGIVILEPQLKADPYDAPTSAASSYMWKGDALLRFGKVQDAISSYRKAAAILEAPQSVPPDKPEQAQLADSYTKLGAALAKASSDHEADAAYRKALQTAEPLNTGKEPNLRVAYVLADTYFALGELARKTAQQATPNPAARPSWSEARDWYGKSLSQWRAIPNPGPMGPFGSYYSNLKEVADDKARCDAALAQLR